MEKTPTKFTSVEQEVRNYTHNRFEEYMQKVDRGEIERSLAIAALKYEITGEESLSQ